MLDKMSQNWYQKVKEKQSTSRYTGNLLANIVVPENMDKMQEGASAYDALKQALPKSGFIGDAVVNFDIQGVEPYGKLV